MHRTTTRRRGDERAPDAFGAPWPAPETRVAHFLPAGKSAFTGLGMSMELLAETSPNGIRESKGCSTRALSWASASATVPPHRCAQQRQVGARARPGPSPPLRGSTSSSRRISPPRLRPSRPHSAAMRSRPGPCSSHRPLPMPTPARPAADPRASRSTIPSRPRNRTSPSRTPQTLRK